MFYEGLNKVCVSTFLSVSHVNTYCSPVTIHLYEGEIVLLSVVTVRTTLPDSVVASGSDWVPVAEKYYFVSED